MLSAYALTFGGLLLLGGRAADLLGRRRLFMTGVLLFTAASLMGGLAWLPAALLAARVVQGVGAAIITPTALSIIATTFPDSSERNKALGIWGALGGVDATAAWLIGGPLVDGPGCVLAGIGMALALLLPGGPRKAPQEHPEPAAATAPGDEVGADNANKRRTEMGKIVMSDNVSLDGVVQDPAGDEGFRVGGWVGLIAGHPELAKLTLDEALGAEALLLGRRSYEWLAARWPSRSGELADRLNSMPKFVVSSSLATSRLEQLDGTQGRCGAGGLEAEAGATTGKSRSPPVSS